MIVEKCKLLACTEYGLKKKIGVPLMPNINVGFSLEHLLEP